MNEQAGGWYSLSRCSQGHCGKRVLEADALLVLGFAFSGEIREMIVKEKKLSDVESAALETFTVSSVYQSLLSFRHKMK